MRLWCLYGAHIQMHKLGVLDVITMFTHISTELNRARLEFSDDMHFCSLLKKTIVCILLCYFLCVPIHFEHFCFSLNAFSFVRKHFRTLSAIIAYAIIIWSIRLHYYKRLLCMYTVHTFHHISMNLNGVSSLADWKKS